MILTHCFPWTTWSREEQQLRMRELAENDETHLVLTSTLLQEGAGNTQYLMTFFEDMKSFGLKFADSHAFWGTWSDPGMPLPEWKEILLLRHKMAFRFCERFGITTMAFHTGNTFNSIFGKNLKLEDYYRSLAASLDVLLPEAEKCGVVIALENQWTPLNHSRCLLRIMEQFRSPHLGLCYDSGHGNLMEKGMLFPGRTCVPYIWEDLGSPVEWEENLIEKFSPWMVNCHLHDNNGINDEHKLPGEGTVDWQRIMNVLRGSPRLQCIQNESSPGDCPVSRISGVFRELLRDF